MLASEVFPFEIWDIIFCRLERRDLKTIRLVCREFNHLIFPILFDSTGQVDMKALRARNECAQKLTESTFLCERVEASLMLVNELFALCDFELKPVLDRNECPYNYIHHRSGYKFHVGPKDLGNMIRGAMYAYLARRKIVKKKQKCSDRRFKKRYFFGEKSVYVVGNIINDVVDLHQQEYTCCTYHTSIAEVIVQQFAREVVVCLSGKTEIVTTAISMQLLPKLTFETFEDFGLVLGGCLPSSYPKILEPMVVNLSSKYGNELRRYISVCFNEAVIECAKKIQQKLRDTGSLKKKFNLAIEFIYKFCTLAQIKLQWVQRRDRPMYFRGYYSGCSLFELVGDIHLQDVKVFVSEKLTEAEFKKLSYKLHCFRAVRLSHLMRMITYMKTPGIVHDPNDGVTRVVLEHFTERLT